MVRAVRGMVLSVKNALKGREERRGGRVTGRFGEPRNHQSHGGERNEHPEIGRRALQVEDLFHLLIKILFKRNLNKNL